LDVAAVEPMQLERARPNRWRTTQIVLWSAGLDFDFAFCVAVPETVNNVGIAGNEQVIGLVSFCGEDLPVKDVQYQK